MPGNERESRIENLGEAENTDDGKRQRCSHWVMNSCATEGNWDRRNFASRKHASLVRSSLITADFFTLTDQLAAG
jgi:hypothetical protein